MTCEYLSTIKRKPCDYYIKQGYCTRPDRFKCEEYMSRYEFEISYSAMKSFEKCPQAYYLSQIVGIQSIKQSDPLRIGKYVDNVLSGKEGLKDIEVDNNSNDNNNKDKEDMIWLVKAKAIVKGMQHYELDTILQGYDRQKEFTVMHDGIPRIHGFIDFAGKDHFLELKVTSRPEMYKDMFIIDDQVSTYFLSNPNYKYCNMLVVKVPELKLDKNEDVFKYSDRITKDILGRPFFYFGENFNAKEKSFGTKFYRNDFNLEELVRKYKFVSEEIKRCIKENYWMKRKCSCLHPFPCDFKSVCELNGQISDNLYKYKNKKN